MQHVGPRGAAANDCFHRSLTDGHKGKLAARQWEVARATRAKGQRALKLRIEPEVQVHGNP